MESYCINIRDLSEASEEYISHLLVRKNISSMTFILQKRQFSEMFLSKNMILLPCEDVSFYQQMSKEFIEEYRHYLSITHLMCNLNIDLYVKEWLYNFYRDYVDWKTISFHINVLDQETLKLVKRSIYWDIASEKWDMNIRCTIKFLKYGCLIYDLLSFSYKNIINGYYNLCENVISDETCPICYESNGNRKVMLSCHETHVFHEECIREWYLEEPSCPICRQHI